MKRNRRRRRLLRRNPDNHAYHHGLRAAKLADASHPGQALSEAQLSDLVQLYQELQAEFPRSMAVRRLPLDFLVRATGGPGLARDGARDGAHGLRRSSGARGP